MTTHSYFPTLDFEITGDQYVITSDFVHPTPDYRINVDNLIRAGVNSVFVPSTKINLVTESIWEQTTKVNHNVGLPAISAPLVDVVMSVEHGRVNVVDVVTNENYGESFRPTHVIASDGYTAKLPNIDVSTGVKVPNDFTDVDSTSDSMFYNILPYVDVGSSGEFHSVYVRDPDKTPPPDYKYYVNNGEFGNEADFSINADPYELNEWTFDFVEPIDYDKFTTRLSPVHGGNDLPWQGVGDLLTGELSLPYDNSIGNLVIATPVSAPTNTDEDAIEEPPEPPPEPPEFKEVIRLVNIINVVTLPERTAINFSNFTLAIDLNSVAWVGSFDITDQASLNLIKPQGLTVKEIEVDINGQTFVLFIGRTSTSISTGSDGTVQKRIKVTGWSNSKRLSYPYSAKRSHVETSPATPAQLVNDELTGTGFTSVWDTVSWTIPANVFGYIDKAPLAAISELAQSIGAIIKPSLNTNEITIAPYYPVSPWNWDTETPDRVLLESQFFTMDTEWIPQESPDSVYVYGEENGVAVKCVKQGTAGLKTLPTIVDKHITDTIAGTERGRIEVAKNQHKELIPITTYVDENGLIMPQELLEVHETGGGTWRGMVVSNSISIKRNGNAIVQSIQVERHYD